MNSINQVIIVNSVESKRVEFGSDQRRGGQACSYIMTIRRAKNFSERRLFRSGRKIFRYEVDGQDIRG